VHAALKKVTEDIGERFNFNTAISAIMEAVNALYGYSGEKGDGVHNVVLAECLEILVLMLAPFAPHLAEELWSVLGNPVSVHLRPWPAYDAAVLSAAEVEIVIQINGKVRGRLTVPAGLTQEAMLEQAVSDNRIALLVAGRELLKAVAVPDKLVNLVVR
jgi:leucyl-tRNA synthetase